MREPIPTYKEFRKAVVQSFHEEWPQLTVEEAAEYVAKEEAYIKERYEANKANYLAGKITRRVFMVGCVAAVGRCLALMY